MNKCYTKGIAVLLAAFACMAQAGAAGTVEKDRPLSILPSLPQQLVSPPGKAPVRLNTPGPGTVFQENFETVTAAPPYDLPAGWTISPTPGLPEDKWIAATLYGEKGVIAGKYAVILPSPDNTTPHDSWMFSPAIELEGGKNYRFEFLVWMQSSYGNDESLHLYLGSQPDPGSMEEEVFYGSKSLNGWAKVTRFFAPSASGTYYMGFHADSPAGTGGMMVDNIMVSDGDSPYFEGPVSMDFGETDELASPIVNDYIVKNNGAETLELSLKEASPEIRISGLPSSVAGFDEATLQVTLDVREACDYKGFFILTTNDPVSGDIRVEVTAKVLKSVITDYMFEDFEKGGPDGWILPKGTVNGANNGQGGGRAFVTTSFVCLLNDDGLVGFTTNYVEMGDKPEFKFSYRLTNTDLMGIDLNVATPEEEPKIQLLVSDDNGSTWANVYTIAASEGNPHVASTDYRRISIPLPDYAGKRCRFAVKFGHDNDDFMAPIEKPYLICVDDVEAGTPHDCDMALGHLRGITLGNCEQEMSYMARVRNMGASHGDAFKVELYDIDNGDVLDSYDAPGVEHLATLDCPLSFIPHEQRTYRVKARVIIPDDDCADNDESNIMAIAVNGSNIKSQKIIDDTRKLLSGPAYPINFYAVNSETQTIYKANEIGMSDGKINSIVYYSSNNGDYLSEQFQIYVGETDLDNFDESQFVDPSTLTKVFDGTVYIPDGRQFVVIPFDEPYQFKGRNLVVYGVKHGREFIEGKNFILCPSDEKRSMTRYADWDEEAAQVESVVTYPIVDMYVEMSPSGTLTGTVHSGGQSIQGARIVVEGTKYSTVADNTGSFSLANVKAGEGRLLVDALGYATTLFPYSIKEDETAVVSIDLAPIPTYSVNGRVQTDAGSPVANARVNLSGYDSFETVTDSQGEFSISGVWSRPGESYLMTVYNPYYKTAKAFVEVNGSDKTVPEVIVRPELHRPFATKVELKDGAAHISWHKPFPEMHHDTGVLATSFGSSGGWSEVIFGTAYNKRAVLHEISWYLVEDEHDNFNVFVFGLTDGLPDKKKIMYVSRGVEFKDNSWNNFVLPEPLEADGFMVALSCDGFMGIGATEVTDEYPLERGMDYFAGESYNYTISDQKDLEINSHYMIRAVAEELGESGSTSDADYIGPEVTYNVYRIDGQNRILLGNTGDLSFMDTDIASIPEGRQGKVKYAIEAVYSSGKSRAVETSALETCGVEPVLKQSDICIVYDRMQQNIHFYTADGSATVRVFSSDGCVVITQDNVDSIDVSGLAPGVYLVNAVDESGHNAVIKIIK